MRNATIVMYIPLQGESGRMMPEQLTEKAIHKAKAAFTQWGEILCYEASFCRQAPNDKRYVEQRVMVVECQTPHVMEPWDKLIRELEVLGGEIANDLRVDKIYLRSPNGDIDPVAALRSNS